MDEREGSVATEDLDAAQGCGRIGCSRLGEAREGSCETEIGFVAEDGHCVRKARRSGREARESEGDGAGYAVSTQLLEAGDIRRRDAESLFGDRVRELAHEEGVPAARLVKRDADVASTSVVSAAPIN